VLYAPGKEQKVSVEFKDNSKAVKAALEAERTFKGQ
jgi:hypothetical protein